MKFNFSKDFRREEYAACLEELGTAIKKLFKESGCQIKPMMKILHVGHKCLKGVCPDAR